MCRVKTPREKLPCSSETFCCSPRRRRQLAFLRRRLRGEITGSGTTKRTAVRIPKKKKKTDPCHAFSNKWGFRFSERPLRSLFICFSGTFFFFFPVFSFVAEYLEEQELATSTILSGVRVYCAKQKGGMMLSVRNLKSYLFKELWEQ